MTLQCQSDVTDVSTGTGIVVSGLPAICQPTFTVSGACFHINYNGTTSGGFFRITAGSSSVALFQSYDDGVNPMAYQVLNSVGDTGLVGGWSITYPIA